MGYMEEFLYAPGTECTVNGFRDLAFESEAKKFIGEDCVIVKRCRSGLIQVALINNPKMVYSVPQSNITIK